MFGELGYIQTTTNQLLTDVENRTPKLLGWLIDMPFGEGKPGSDVLLAEKKEQIGYAQARARKERHSTAWMNRYFQNLI